ACGGAVADGHRFGRLWGGPGERTGGSSPAGDSFNAGFLAALISGKDTDAAMAAGHRLAARVVQHPGAIIL
ncbi:MAG: PfkB family carbohydrate kinase, partial [Pseudomonadota bacterium]